MVRFVPYSVPLEREGLLQQPYARLADGFPELFVEEHRPASTIALPPRPLFTHERPYTPLHAYMTCVTRMPRYKAIDTSHAD